METTKRTYQKHKVGGKATVKQFLNTKVKEYSRSNFSFPESNLINTHPIYINISVKRQNTSARSLFDINCTIEEYEIRKNFYLRYEKYESQRIQFISDKLRPYENDNFKISDLLFAYKMDLQKIPFIVNELLYLEIIDVCPEAIFGYRVSPLSVLIHFENKYPELKLLREKYSSDIWKFDYYYENFLGNIRFNDSFSNQDRRSHLDYKFTNFSIFLNRFNSFFEPIHYDLVTGEFQEEFMGFFSDPLDLDDKIMQEEIAAKAIIKDLNELYTKHEAWIQLKLYGMKHGFN